MALRNCADTQESCVDFQQLLCNSCSPAPQASTALLCSDFTHGIKQVFSCQGWCHQIFWRPAGYLRQVLLARKELYPWNHWFLFLANSKNEVCHQSSLCSSFILLLETISQEILQLEERLCWSFLKGELICVFSLTDVFQWILWSGTSEMRGCLSISSPEYLSTVCSDSCWDLLVFFSMYLLRLWFPTWKQNLCPVGWN